MAVLLLTLVSGPAFAQVSGAPPGSAGCTDAPELCGRKAFGEGVTAFDAKDYERAVERFEEALRYRAHPAIALNLALALSGAGRYLAALGHLDSILADKTADASLRARAERERGLVERRLAVVELDGGEGHVGEAWLDGAPFPSGSVRVDPGTHELTIAGAGGKEVKRSIVLSPGERLRVTVDRTREILVVPERIVPPSEPDGRPSPRPAPAVHPAPEKEAEPAGLHPAWFFVGAGATAVLGGVAVWSALDTKSAYDEYRARVPEASRSELASRIDEGHGLETRTNVLFAVTGVAALGTAAVGVFLVDWGGPSRPTSLGVGPGSLTLRSAF